MTKYLDNRRFKRMQHVANYRAATLVKSVRSGDAIGGMESLMLRWGTSKVRNWVPVGRQQGSPSKWQRVVDEALAASVAPGRWSSASGFLRRFASY